MPTFRCARQDLPCWNMSVRQHLTQEVPRPAIAGALRYPRLMFRIPDRRRYALAMFALPVLFSPMVPGGAARAAAPLTADETSVSTGSWFCSRHAEAAAVGATGAATDVLSAVRSFMLGYVYGVSDAVGKPFPETSTNEKRITDLLDGGCSQDPARAVRDAALLAGRAMLEDPRSLEGSTAADAIGALACSVYLDVRGAADGAPSSQAAGSRAAVRDWADGYINARFERAGRGLIPTARNKALMLDRFTDACAANPATTVREAARSVVGATIPVR